MGLVYFIEMVGRDLVKIGDSWDPVTRARQLQTGNPIPLRLLDFVVGDEKAIHRRFARYRVQGEWFRLSDEIKAYIADHGASPGARCPERVRVALTWLFTLPPFSPPFWLAIAVWAATNAAWYVPLALWLAGSVAFVAWMGKTAYSHQALHSRLGTPCPIEVEAAERAKRMKAWDEGRRKTTLAELKSYKRQLEQELRRLERQIVESAMAEETRESVVQAFTEFPGVGVRTAERLWDAGFTTLDKLGQASEEALMKVEGIGPTIASRIHTILSDRPPVSDTPSGLTGMTAATVERRRQALITESVKRHLERIDEILVREADELGLES